jgi:hypothetical protein
MNALSLIDAFLVHHVIELAAQVNPSVKKTLVDSLVSVKGEQDNKN